MSREGAKWAKVVIIFAMLVLFAGPSPSASRRLLLRRASTAASGDPYTYFNTSRASLTFADPASPTSALMQKITVPTNGMATKLYVFSQAQFGGNLKIALYNAARDTVLASGTSAIPNDGGAVDRDLEVTISATAVTAATDYWIAFIADGVDADFKFAASGGDRKYLESTTYGAFPTTPFGESGGDAVLERVGVFVTP